MQRVRYLDLYRYLTVSFAIASHAILSVGLILELDADTGLYLKSLTRSATPSLIVLFGMMIEIVYARKWDTSKAETLGALWHRVLLCYLCLVGLAFVEFSVTDAQWTHLIGSVGLVRGVWNGTIFKLYMFLLALVPVFLAIRLRFGAIGLAMFAIALFVFHAIALDSLPVLPRVVAHLGGLLFGIGDTFGPSVIHASALIVFGMLLGSIVTGRASRSAKAIFAVMLSLSVAIWVYYIIAEGFHVSIGNVAEYRQWRAQNHPAYFAFGMMASIVILVLSFVVTKVAPRGLVRIPEAVGGATLIYFFIGNVLIGFGSLLKWATIGEMVAVIASYVVLSTVAVQLWIRHAKPARMVVGFNRASVRILTSAWGLSGHYAKGVARKAASSF